MNMVPLQEYIEALNRVDIGTKKLMNTEILFDSLEAVVRESQVSVETKDLLLPFGYFFLRIISRDDLEKTLTEYGLKKPLTFMESVLDQIEITKSKQTHSTSIDLHTTPTYATDTSSPGGTSTAPISSTPAPHTTHEEPVVGYAALEAESIHQSNQSDILQPPEPPIPPQTRQ